ncbi:2-dehydro-3-deoxygalactonokinase [Algibacillus agarilyticus]|uniref:2-dehydro-3-deoxygalactonokinase n=1 Tax=Algibacillus agarilyticus TaxID=2234133 RepID=UPI000DCFD58E|nr:2-dehydro-3-deoxygalactonokinase [Algibacillus agarilyticus]
MNKTDKNNYLIIDWGTSNFRAFLMSADHQLIQTHQESMGLLQVKNNNFAHALQTILQHWLIDYATLPVYMAGMVGSANGWHNIDYIQTPTNAQKLKQGAYSFTLPWGAAAVITPGVKHSLNPASFDVMRGEEVQILGLSKLTHQNNYMAILPGTHSKHVTVENGQIIDLKTYMTGELFAIITQHSILGKNLPPQQTSEQMFLKGVMQSTAGELTHLLFLARTHLLFNNINDEHIHEFISGLLIGHELQNIKGELMHFVGGESLCQRYLAASNALSIKAKMVDGDTCFLNGMAQLI